MTALQKILSHDPLTKFLFDDVNSVYFHQNPLGYLKRETAGQVAHNQLSADIFESESHYFLQLDVPGVSKDDISVEFEDGLLVIKGERTNVPPTEDAKRVFSNRRPAKYQQTFRLPDTVDPEKISGSYKDGVLSVTVEKRKKPEPVKIKLAGDA